MPHHCSLNRIRHAPASHYVFPSVDDGVTRPAPEVKKVLSGARDVSHDVVIARVLRRMVVTEDQGLTESGTYGQRKQLYFPLAQCQLERKGCGTI